MTMFPLTESGWDNGELPPRGRELDGLSTSVGKTTSTTEAHDHNKDDTKNEHEQDDDDTLLILFQLIANRVSHDTHTAWNTSLSRHRCKTTLFQAAWDLSGSKSSFLHWAIFSFGNQGGYRVPNTLALGQVSALCTRRWLNEWSLLSLSPRAWAIQLGSWCSDAVWPRTALAVKMWSRVIFWRLVWVVIDMCVGYKGLAGPPPLPPLPSPPPPPPAGSLGLRDPGLGGSCCAVLCCAVLCWCCAVLCCVSNPLNPKQPQTLNPKP